MDHREITILVPVMNEVQLLFSFEPRKSLKSRSLYVVFLVEKDVRVERRRASNYLHHEEIEWQYEVCARSYQKHRNEEEGLPDKYASTWACCCLRHRGTSVRRDDLWNSARDGN